MPFLLTMPKLSPTMSEGTIVKWHKQAGDRVEPGDLLLEIATDKATVEHNSIDSGWFRKILIEAGQEASVNQPIALLTETKEENIDNFTLPTPEKPIEMPAQQPPEMKEAAPSRQEPTKAPASRQPAFIPEPPVESYEFEYSREAQDDRLRASPLAKKIAIEKSLDLSSIKGSGPNGRIMKRDLDKAQPVSQITFRHNETPALAPGTYEEIPLSPIRKVIAQRLQDSKSFIPHFYVNQEIDAEPLSNLCEQLKKGGAKISINTCIVRACALALRAHANINTGFNSVNQSIIQFKTIDISVAVTIEQGLITPIVRHADYKNLGELAAEIRELAQRAKQGKLSPHEYKGGSFTLSNLGMYNVTSFQAIINPPQAAILAVSAIRNVPVVDNGVVRAGQRMNLCLSVDHRVIDGVAAAIFVASVQNYLENPVMLIV